ncbi:MAG: DinB family protein [Gemmatimonadetes bacterium]|nr:DinB family protein [Gemmatimonadota bacterium]NNK49121.1 DinB family protein [Gemmatimonadota bacterium]
MNEGLPEASVTDPPTAEQPLVPELEGYRAGFRWAKGEIRNLTGALDPAAYNARPSEKSWSAAECVEHLSATAREMIPALEAGVARARENGWLAHGPFEYGRFEKWFARQAGGEELPPKRRFKAPKLYHPPHRTYDMEAAVGEFLSLQDRYIETLQLASGVNLVRVKVASPAMSLLKLSLGQWLRAMESHQRRHLWQAREAVRKVS